MLSEDIFHQRGIALLYCTCNVIIQSGIYGIYASLILTSTYIMIQKGLYSRSQKILFGVIVFMFSLSTAYLAVSIADLIILIKTWYLVLDISKSASATSPTNDLLLIFNALAPINFVLTDGVVVWRAWVICRDEYRKLLAAPIVMFVLTMFGVVATIGVRAFINNHPVNSDKDRLADTIDVFQEITFMSSLVTNILGTGVISLKAWRYRKWIVADIQLVVNMRTKAERVLALLVESGVLYIFSGSIMVASSLIRLPGSHYVLESLYSQAAVHLAGIYPLLVVILVDREASMDKTLFNSTLRGASSHFIANPTAARQLKAKSTPMAGFSMTAQEPLPTWRSLDPSFIKDSLTSSSSLESDV